MCRRSSGCSRTRLPVLDDDGVLLYAIQVLEDITATRQEMEISANLLTLAEAATETMDMERLQTGSYDAAVPSSRLIACSVTCGSDGAVRSSPAGLGLARELTPVFRTESIDLASGFFERLWTSAIRLQLSGAHR